ncbi:MAG: 30S ribosomal protein S2 [Kiritimatiellaeota bacterium]|nr:30S ribosomal protein S2 [Kiritimatiellota bacterium]
MADTNELSLTVTVNDLLDAGLHFGHQSKRWNPKMKRFIFAKRGGIYIIDLAKSLSQLREAQRFVYETVAHGKGILFVGTKKAAQEIIKEAATRCGHHYIISRWLGGTLTNNQNIASSVRRMRKIQELDTNGSLASMPQKEASRLRHEQARLERNLSGIANLAGMPGALMVVDVNREAIAVREANRMGIPVIAIVDTNTDPDPIKYPIPGNDDSTRAIKLIVNVMTEAIIKAEADFAVVRAQEKAAAEAAAKERPATEASRPRARKERGDDRRPRRGGGRGGRPHDRGASAAEKEADTKTEAAEKPEAPAADPKSA